MSFVETDEEIDQTLSPGEPGFMERLTKPYPRRARRMQYLPDTISYIFYSNEQKRLCQGSH